MICYPALVLLVGDTSCISQSESTATRIPVMTSVHVSALPVMARNGTTIIHNPRSALTHFCHIK